MSDEPRPVLESAEQIDDRDIITERVSTPELPGDVMVRVIDSGGMELIATLAKQAKEAGADKSVKITFTYRVVLLCVCDTNGKPLYDAESDTDLARVKGWPFDALERVVEAAMKLNGMDDETVAKAEAALTGPLAGSTRTSSAKNRARSKKRKRRSAPRK